MKVKTIVLSDALKASLARMLEAQEAEASAKANAASIVSKAETSCWSTLRDIVKATLYRKAAKPKKGEEAPNVIEETDALLSNFRDACKDAVKGGKEGMQKGVQYAADLRRLVKAARDSKAVPKELFACPRSEYLNAEFWKEAGILAPSGKKRGSTNAGNNAQGEGEGEEGKEGEVGTVAAKAADPKLSELFQRVAKLHGPFKDEWLAVATKEANRILAKQRAAGQEVEEEVTDKPAATANG